MDRAVFFDRVRAKPFGGSLVKTQVSGLETLLDAWTGSDLRQLAYLLATAFHETAATMQPDVEIGRGKGHPYGVVDQTGLAPFGRGYVQLTWRANYLKADAALGLGGRLAADYDLALKADIAAQIIVRGMLEGWFTGRKLGDYIAGGKADYVQARRIVNGTDRAGLIASYAVAFEAALRAAGAVGMTAPAPASPASRPASSSAPTASSSPPSLLALIASFVTAFGAWRNVGK